MARSALALFLLTSVAYAWPVGLPAPKPRAYQTTPQHVDNAIIEALIFLETKVDPSDWPYYRFFHFLDSADENLSDDITNFRAYLSFVSSGPVPVRPIPVDKLGNVWAVKFYETGWNAEAFHAVARLDTKCRQPHVNPQLAEELRRAVGVNLDKESFHCEGMIPANWFVREIQETARHRNDPENIAYYNLLYAKERFGGYDYAYTGKVARTSHVRGSRDPKPEYPPETSRWPGGIWPKEQGGDGRYWAEGSIKPRTQWDIDQYKKSLAAWESAGESDTTKKSAKLGNFHKAIDRNFPRNKDDFDLRWGIKASEDFLASQTLYKRNGTVIAGFKNDPKAGSIVSYNDRVNLFLTTPLGLSMNTQDFDITAGRKNPSNQPLEVSLAELEEDASEAITQKPDDFPAFGLFGAAKAKRPRVEFGDPLIVRNSLDPHSLAVLTFNGCILCHYPSDVVLSPSNEKILKSLRARNELFAYTDSERVIIDQFFAGGDFVGDGWKRKLKGWREPFAASLSIATATVAEPKGWSGAVFASKQQEHRNRYDSIVTFPQACAELGYPRLAVVVALTSLGTFDAGELLVSDGVARDVWDNDLFPALSGYMAYLRDAEFGDPLILYYFPDLVRDARGKLFNLKRKDGGK